MIPEYVIAGLWGGIGSFGLLLGGFFGYEYKISKKVIAIITAFSSGILISAVCFELLFEAYYYGNLYTITIGFIAGVLAFTVVDTIINRFSIKKQPNDNNSTDDHIDPNNLDDSNNDTKYTNHAKDSNYSNDNVDSNNISDYNIISHRYKLYFNKYQIRGITTFAAALLDGIPESIAIGLIYFIGGPISLALLIAVFIANSFEGLSASSFMKLGGWNGKDVLGLWIFVLILTSTSAMLSYIIFSHTDYYILSIVLSVTAGAIIAMIADTMLPEAFSEMQEFTGFFMAMGFLISFILSHLTVH